MFAFEHRGAIAPSSRCLVRDVIKSDYHPPMDSFFKVNRVEKSRIDDIDFDNLQFGTEFSDHMFTMEFYDGKWRDARIIPFGMIEMHPVSVALHYGQTIFEGMKAYRGIDGAIRIFRPEMNHRRLTDSCNRMCIPPIDEDVFIRAVEQLVKVDNRWVPDGERQALYVRPVLFATEGNLDVRPANAYRFLIITSPVGSYFKGDAPSVSLKVEENYTRAIRGGTGFAKTGGNYAATFRPAIDSQNEGFAQVIWLDGEQHCYVEEVGQMNICFYLNGKLVTPNLRGTILPGVTRDSILQLSRDMGIPCEERQIHIREVIDGIKSGTLQEAFGCGTAAVVTVIGSLGYRNEIHQVPVPDGNSLSKRLYDTIVGIQRGAVEDRYGWTRIVSI